MIALKERETMVWRAGVNDVVRVLKALLLMLVFLFLMVCQTTAYVEKRHKNAYAALMYMGTPRDYEFYVATRVMIRSLPKLNVDADLVVIASLDVPLHWVQAL